MSESYMEKALLKLARQINAFDEASLMSLWEKYAEKVSRFEPTKRWEEAVLVFNLIQSTRMKNQLFNYNWAQSRMPEAPAHEVDLAALTAPEKVREPAPELEEKPSADEKKRDRKGKVLTLTPKNKN
ncbi:hypothetical protein GM415_11040 [Pseudodesulfovibrio cashew]|uniref:Uncharacterized protein n=1 Tax=Pseudodesulfovibrio cashew TaxID=2678688 RepID=A0A6I6JCU8_9BACT|nr:hypothetical protein [Pseudodesulfovibrio cashew]QGY40635.1 hypothetical protein GM415_11040 [Pseudodesulfovibrio cashew]